MCEGNGVTLVRYLSPDGTHVGGVACMTRMLNSKDTDYMVVAYWGTHGIVGVFDGCGGWLVCVGGQYCAGGYGCGAQPTAQLAPENVVPLCAGKPSSAPVLLAGRSSCCPHS